MNSGKINLIDIIGNTTQLGILQSKVIEDLIEFKWDNYARRF
jgi:hypothetical protein